MRLGDENEINVSPEDNSEQKRDTIVYNIIMIIGIIALAIGGMYVFKDGSQYRASRKEYAKIREEAIDEDGDVVNIIDEEPVNDQELPSSGQYEMKKPHKLLKVNFNALEATNKETVAWLRFENAKINYPVVQPDEENADKYLNTTFTGMKNPSGCIFMLPDQDPGLDNLNTFFYGHNMKDGSMFGTLKELYRDPSKIIDPYIEVYMSNGKIRLYRVFSIYKADEDSTMYKGINDDTYDEYIASAINRSSYSAGRLQALIDHRKLLTLSTCYGAENSGERLLLHAVQVEFRQK